MDVLAHALWAGAGVLLVRRRKAVSTRAAAVAVGLATAPDLPHLLPILGWSVFGEGTARALETYAQALPGQEPALPPLVALLSHHLHCITHSAVVAGVVTLLAWAWRHSLWMALLGWWSHVVIDVFTHSAHFYPSPVLYPITREGFDGIAWNTPGFIALNYTALTASYLWLWWTRPARIDDDGRDDPASARPTGGRRPSRRRRRLPRRVGARTPGRPPAGKAHW